VRIHRGQPGRIGGCGAEPEVTIGPDENGPVPFPVGLTLIGHNLADIQQRRRRRAERPG